VIFQENTKNINPFDGLSQRAIQGELFWKLQKGEPLKKLF